MNQPGQARKLFVVPMLVFVLVSIPAAAIDTLHFEMATVEGPGWKAEDVSLALNWHSLAEATVIISAARLQLPPPLALLTDVILTCPNTVIDAETIRCIGGLLHLNHPALDRADINVDLTYYPASGAVDVSLKEAQLAGGILNVTGNLSQPGWQLNLAAKSLDSAKLPAALKDLMSWPGDLKSTGKLAINAQLVGKQATIMEAKFDGAVTSLNFSNEGGHWAGEKLSADFQLNAKPEPDNNWQFQGRISANTGQLYLEPIFLEFPPAGIKLNAHGVWNPKRGKLAITQFMLSHPEVAQAQASLEFKLNPLQVDSATLKISDAAFAPFYQTYLQPLLIGTAFDALENTGHIGVDLDYQEQSVASITVNMNDAGLEDQRGRFGLNGLNGTLAWTRDATPLRSDFNWDSGHVYKLALGASRVKMQSSQSDINLLEATALPVLDGALQIENLNVQKLAAADMNLQLTGALTPVSMKAFSTAMDWPAMSGKFSSVIPKLTYTQNSINVGGAVQMRIFDGDVIVRNLRLEEPFGVLPLLSADVGISKIDLDTLTHTFSFGKIQGKLSGEINNLRMANWTPVAFDAKFATPADDNSRHRISQKAVNSLSSLGGASGVLSRSLLRFFDEFSYARLGLSCRLDKGVCEMGGVEPAESGYYIVKGGGIPRIDVRGFATEVDWNVLMERLKNATRSEGPIVQ